MLVDLGKLGCGADTVPAFVGPNAVSVAIGEGHTCAVFTDGALRGWGQNSNGEFGYGHTQTIGDDDVPLDAGKVSVGGKAVQVVAGGANLTSRARSAGRNGGRGYWLASFVSREPSTTLRLVAGYVPNAACHTSMPR